MSQAPQQAPDVSVLIAAYNVEAVISRAVYSALNQQNCNLEVLVIDDASTDTTAQVVSDLSQSDARVRLIRAPENGGPGAARTLGLKVAKGTWIAVLDADDSFVQGRLERLICLARENRADAIADNLLLVDPGTEQVLGNAFPMKDDVRLRLTPMRLIKNTVPAGRVNLGWCKPLVKRSFLSKKDITWRAFRHAEDFGFYMDILLNEGEFLLVGRPGYLYTQRRGSVSGVVSPHSRTQRSVDEQQKVIDDLISRNQAHIGAEVTSALVRMKRQMEVTAQLLDMRDALDRNDLRGAVKAVAPAFARLGSLIECMWSRFGIGAMRIR